MINNNRQTRHCEEATPTKQFMLKADGLLRANALAMTISRILFFIFFLSLPLSAHAEEKFFLPEVITENEVIKKEQLEETVKKAETDPKLQFILGVMYYQGRGVDRTEEEGVKYLQKASENSEARAALDLSYIYLLGSKQFPRDGEKALGYLKKAADLGNIKAMLQLSGYYEKGQGLPQDTKKAMEYLNKAYEAGSFEAAERIALMYRRGEIVKKNPDKAVEIYSYMYGASQDPKVKIDNALHISVMYRDGKELPKDEKRSVLWLKRAADLDDQDSQARLAVIYRDGKIVPQNYPEAMKYLEKAAGNGNIYAEANLGYMYINGVGVEKNCGKALDHYRQAALHNNAEAAESLAEIYNIGMCGVKPDAIAVAQWKETARKARLEEKKNKL